MGKEPRTVLKNASAQMVPRQSFYPGRIWQNMASRANLGDERVTVPNLQVMQWRSEKIILVTRALFPIKLILLVVRPAIRNRPKNHERESFDQAAAKEPH